jgi:hypothetical protein
MESEEKTQFATLDNLADLIIDIWDNMMHFNYALIELFGPCLFSPHAPPLAAHHIKVNHCPDTS